MIECTVEKKQKTERVVEEKRKYREIINNLNVLSPCLCAYVAGGWGW